MAINEICFSQPHWLLTARGLRPEPWFEQGVASGTGGILMPKPISLSVGHRYYRFASSTTARDSQVGGGWWIDYENFRLIEDYARQFDYSLTESARLFLSLPVEWTRVDRLVSAILEQPLKAYAGEGKPVRSGGDSPDANWTPMQHRKAKQMFIPGLYQQGRAPREQLFRQAFPHPVVTFANGNRAAA